MFKKVLVANRGAIACRILRTLDGMGIASVAIYSKADRHALHVMRASQAIAIGDSPASESYLRGDKIIAAALSVGADAIHPGYGFLSESPDFAKACGKANLTFIGPSPDHMRAFGLKHKARALAVEAGVPLAPGSDLARDLDHAYAESERIGYPIMLKSTAGGGGIGLQLVTSRNELKPLFESVTRLAHNNFNDAGLFVEKYIARARHIEVQIFGDGKGGVSSLGERDCSAQRRNQKVIEETPAPHLDETTRQALADTAVRLGKSVKYESAGTVEFLLDADTNEFYFLEVNTRLQVEHGVTEEVTCVDLVEWMLRQAAGETPPQVGEQITTSGASIQVRLYAEDPGRDFQPSSGLLTQVEWPKEARIESWVESGTDVSPFYDPMLAKIIVNGSTREQALQNLQSALDATRISGLETNLDYLRQLAKSEILIKGLITTSSLQDFHYTAATIEVVTTGTQTSIQDWPGRLGLWSVGVPPSGPMDALSFRLANRLVGNDEGTPGLEITLSGPVLKFNTQALVCLTGADIEAHIDGKPVPLWQAVKIDAGATLSIGTITGAGARAYLGVRGGFDVPCYLGSAATFALGKFGGHGGRTLLPGDILHLNGADTAKQNDVSSSKLNRALRPPIFHNWEIGVLYGPHGAPDFFTKEDIANFFAADWEVHYNSNRTGVRLSGPKPEWARKDGGEAGLHPSNIHDNAYAIGAIDYTGDMPVILGPDGPSLGGFVCPVTLAQAELWKMGQLRPGDKIRFVRLSPEEAKQRLDQQNEFIATLTPRDELLAPTGELSIPAISAMDFNDCILAQREETPSHPRVVYRRAGDANLLVEYGPIILDFTLRFRVHDLMVRLEERGLEGILDLTPGIRSLQIHYDSQRLALDDLLCELHSLQEEATGQGDIIVPSRIVRMPLSWDDPAIQITIDKYSQAVRPDAPWCPSNIEFIRRINGLESIDDVRRIVFDAKYLVLGLGDVYLGAPVATPLDPRHRLVTTKYNPARTWTPDNVVGIGGAYMCVYGMEGPGGYQLFGRTCQVWNPFHTTKEFGAGKPWLLNFFDQIQFYPVSHEELTEFRDGFLQGRVGLDITKTSFSLGDYQTFLDANQQEIRSFKRQQQKAFEEERSRWQESEREGGTLEPETLDRAMDTDELAPGQKAILSPVPGSVWKIESSPGQCVKAGETLIIVESMKMEMTVAAPTAGIVTEIKCIEGSTVTQGQLLLVLDTVETETSS